MSNLTLKEQLEALALDSSTTLTPSAETTIQQAPQRVVNSSTKQKPAWLEQAQYGVELLKAHFPASFKAMQAIQPLKIGIKQELVIRLSSKNDITLSDKACMVNSLSYYVSAVAYLKNVIEGATRIDLDGQPAGVVTAEEARYSMESRQAKLQKKAKPAKQSKRVIPAKAGIQG